MRKPTIFALAIAVLLAATVTSACSKKDSSNPTAPSPAPQVPQLPEAIFYAAIGASDAIGIGASIPCFPFAPCPLGTGYVPLIARRLDENHTVTLTNLGIPGAVIGPHFEALSRQYGRDIPANFVEREVPFVPQNANVVTVFAGGNDSNVVGRAIQGGAAGTNPAGFISGEIRAFGVEFDAVIRGIRQRAASPRIVVANLPNYAGIPSGQAYTVAERQLLQRISVGFSTEVINRLTSQGVIVVDLLCDSRSYNPGTYSSDGFHMSDEGYAFMAAEMLEAITVSSYPSPRSSCGEMTIVPAL